MVAGPRGRACWRILDAQFFGLAQRRKRVFVVFCPRNRDDPCQVLFEQPRLPGHSAPSGEAREDVALPLAGSPEGGSGYRNDADTAENLIAYGLRAKQNLSHRADCDTLVAADLRNGTLNDLAQTMQSGGKDGERGAAWPMRDMRKGDAP